MMEITVAIVKEGRMMGRILASAVESHTILGVVARVSHGRMEIMGKPTVRAPCSFCSLHLAKSKRMMPERYGVFCVRVAICA